MAEAEVRLTEFEWERLHAARTCNAEGHDLEVVFAGGGVDSMICARPCGAGPWDARVPAPPTPKATPACHCWYDGPPCPRHNADGTERPPEEAGL